MLLCLHFFQIFQIFHYLCLLQIVDKHCVVDCAFGEGVRRERGAYRCTSYRGGGQTCFCLLYCVDVISIFMDFKSLWHLASGISGRERHAFQDADGRVAERIDLLLVISNQLKLVQLLKHGT